MKFQDENIITKLAAENIFKSERTEDICHALVSVAFYEPDWLWAQNQCLNFLQHTNSEISGLAATCLGHIARVHQQLEREKVISVLQQHLGNVDITGRVQDALDDIERFLPK